MGPVHNPLFGLPPERRFKTFTLSPELLFNSLFSPLKTSEGVYCMSLTLDGEPPPEDLKFEAILYDPMDRVFRVRIWSSTFPEILNCDKIPECRIEATSFYK